MKIFVLIITKKILNKLSKLFKFINPNSVIERFIEKDFEIVKKSAVPNTP